MTPEIDHLIVGAPDLDAGIRHVEQLLGVSPAPGGRHQSLGTKNALLSLGEGVYLEVLAPDPVGEPPERPRPLGIDDLEVPRFLTWAARVPDLLALVARARDRGIDLGEVTHGSRTRPDGTTISWTGTDMWRLRAGGVLPFFIDWGDSEHPSRTAPPGGVLEDLRGLHPEPDVVRAGLAALGIDLPVDEAERPGLAARIRTAEGVVQLG